MATLDACVACLRRTDLIAALSGRIEIEWRLRRGRPQLLALPDAALLEWAGDGDVDARYESFSADAAVARLEAAGVGAVCRCSPAFPAGAAELPDPPAVLHLLGDPSVLVHAASCAVALVGARRPSPYGLEVARGLARGLAAAGVPVVSGMAMGVDSAAHAGALAGDGLTVAVLATGADRPYPARSRTLHARIAETGCVVSELPPGMPPRRWAFPARNRLIAALAAGTIVVEGGERSGSLITADFAAELGRFVGAVPGTITSRMAAGPLVLLKAGAELIRGPEDVLDLLHGAGSRGLGAPGGAEPPWAGPATVGDAAAVAHGPAPVVVGSGEGRAGRASVVAPVPRGLPPRLKRVLADVEEGLGTLAQLATGPDDAATVARELSELELLGLVRRGFGGVYVRAAP